jgi:hypothetical protein
LVILLSQRIMNAKKKKKKKRKETCQKDTEASLNGLPMISSE